MCLSLALNPRHLPRFPPPSPFLCRCPSLLPNSIPPSVSSDSVLFLSLALLQIFPSPLRPTVDVSPTASCFHIAYSTYRPSFHLETLLNRPPFPQSPLGDKQVLNTCAGAIVAAVHANGDVFHVQRYPHAREPPPETSGRHHGGARRDEV